LVRRKYQVWGGNWGTLGKAGGGRVGRGRGVFVGVLAGNGFSGGVGTVVVLGVGRWLTGGRGRRIWGKAPELKAVSGE
jgi:hypothetical protein